MFELGQKVRVIGDSFDSIGGKIVRISRTDYLDESGDKKIEVWFHVDTPGGNFTLKADQITSDQPHPKFATPEEAEAWMDEQAGKSWTDEADDWLSGLTDGS